MTTNSSSTVQIVTKLAPSLTGGPIARSAGLVVILALGLVACSPESETTGSINSCARDMFANFSPKILDQCVAACRKCDHGTTVTCTTSCTLKGAH